MAFLPGLCRHLLGEDLQMPSVATGGAAQEEPRRYVLEHLDELVIKPAFPRSGTQDGVSRGDDRSAARASWCAGLKRTRKSIVAQEQVALSTAPVRTDDGSAPRHIVLRVFAAWNGESYSVLPGGLTRVSTEDTFAGGLHAVGGGSKDTWVLSAEDEEVSVTARAPEAPLDCTTQLRRICPAAWPTICSGWAATRNAWNPACGWCGRCCPGFRAKRI